MLLPTPPDRLVDAAGRPYFLWDVEMTLDELRGWLVHPDVERRAYWVAKVMRQAKPDDAIVLIGVPEMQRLWPHVERMLGKTRDFWAWLLLERWADDAPAR